MAPSMLCFLCLILAFMDPCETVDVSATECTAGGTQCNAIANAACDTSASKCKCALITTMSTDTCPFTTCTSGGTQCNADVNAECTGSTPKCACKSTFALAHLENKHVCLATIDSTVCTASGTQCSTIANSYCHGTELKCKCPTITTAGTNACADKECGDAATCTDVDANSECSGTTLATGKCVCKTGFSMGSDGKCSKSGASGVAACLAMIVACILSTIV